MALLAAHLALALLADVERSWRLLGVAVRGRRARLDGTGERLVLLELRLELVLVVDLGLDERLELGDLQEEWKLVIACRRRVRKGETSDAPPA